MTTRSIIEGSPEIAARSTSGRSFEYVFPAIRGIQAGREYFVSMCPLRLLPKIFLFDEEELVPELRAQRSLNRARLPEMVRYINDNPGSYVFSAITASIDGDVHFESSGGEGHGERLGVLRVDMGARFLINDGQHRRAAIELAMKEHPELASESIAVVFFMDAGLARAQQMFADLNRYAIRTSRSLGVLYDQRDILARVVRLAVMQSEFLRPLIEMERSTVAPRSRRLFTLSAVHTGTRALLVASDLDSVESRADFARVFWESAAAGFPDWVGVRNGTLNAADLRKDSIHGHGIVLHALGRIGNALMREGVDPSEFATRLAPLATMDWRRENATVWEGRALIGGRVSKAEQSVILTTNVLKQRLGLPLTEDEASVEAAFGRGR